MKTSFFMTHHSPVGAFSSFTFGALGKGVSIHMESSKIQEVRYDLYACYGIYCICAYALHTKDGTWLAKRADVLRKLLCSMENCEHFDPSKRDGILNTVSSRSRLNGKESTIYDALDLSLMDVCIRNSLCCFKNRLCTNYAERML